VKRSRTAASQKVDDVLKTAVRVDAHEVMDFLTGKL